VLSRIFSDFFVTGKPSILKFVEKTELKEREAFQCGNKSIMHKSPAEINSFQYQPTVTDSPSTFEAKLHKKLKWT